MSRLDARWPLPMRPHVEITPRAMREAVYARAALGGSVVAHLLAASTEDHLRMADVLRAAGLPLVPQA